LKSALSSMASRVVPANWVTMARSSPQQGVQQTRLADVRFPDNHHPAAVAQQFSFTVCINKSDIVLYKESPSPISAPTSTTKSSSRKIDLRLEQRFEPNEPRRATRRSVADSRPASCAEASAASGGGARADQVDHRLGLGEVQAAVQKGAAW